MMGGQSDGWEKEAVSAFELNRVKKSPFVV